MPNWHKTGLGMLRADVLVPMTTYNSTALATEILEGTLLMLEQVSTRLTVLALNSSRTPERPPRVRLLLGDLLEDIQDCENDLGTYALLDA